MNVISVLCHCSVGHFALQMIMIFRISKFRDQVVVCKITIVHQASWYTGPS